MHYLDVLKCGREVKNCPLEPWELICNKMTSLRRITPFPLAGFGPEETQCRHYDVILLQISSQGEDSFSLHGHILKRLNSALNTMFFKNKSHHDNPQEETL